MKRKSNKEYEKALKLYSNGYIDKAIEVLEKGISRDLSNSSLLNLKGILLYIKGDLQEAIALWNINRDYNNDKIALSYLKDVRNDYERKELYIEAEDLIEKLNIDEAIKKLNLCLKSDFNSININNLLAISYFKKGDYERSKEYINKVTEIDKNNYKAKIIKKELNEILEDNNGINKKNIVFSIITITILFLLGIFLKNNFINKNNELNNLGISSSMEYSNNDNSISNNKEEVNNEEIEKIIDSLTEEEIKDNYIKASNYYEEEDYIKVKEVLEKTINGSNESHLKDDMIFLLAATFEKIGDNKKSILNYEEYINLYNDGSYIEEAYYKLALLYKNTDLNKSKKYAGIIKENYSNSIYNNNYIKEIIES